jgi:hypothetical protein
MIDVTQVLEAGRRVAESRMRATYRFTRESGEAVTDPNTGEVTHPDTVVYEGPAYSRYPGLAFEQSPEVGGAVFTISRLVIRCPFGPVFKPGDMGECLADPDNPQMVGARVRVESIDNQSQATAQRLLCSDPQ